MLCSNFILAGLNSLQRAQTEAIANKPQSFDLFDIAYLHASKQCVDDPINVESLPQPSAVPL